MRDNRYCLNAKKAKNDEFYTRYEDIEKEIQHYDLSGKTVYCPCDDFRCSNFVRYFKTNYHRLHLAGLLASNYDIGEGAYKYRYDGNVEVYVPTPTGDFLSPETDPMLDACDIVITNPPFSKWREMFKRIMGSGKEFIVICNGTVCGGKEMLGYFKDGRIWLGHKTFSGGMKFQAGPTFDINKCKQKVRYDEKGSPLLLVPMAVWLTNLGPRWIRPLEDTREYSPDRYPKYDGTDIINVDRVVDIPKDYYGEMGVPITFLERYDPAVWELKGQVPKCSIGGNVKFARLLVQRRR